MIEIQKSNPPIGKEVIKDFADMIGVSFPDDYKNFLCQYNGGTPRQSVFNFKNNDIDNGSDIDGFLGINHPIEVMSMEYILNTFANRIPNELFPIASDSYGNLICLYIKEKYYGKIYFWDHENEAPDGQNPWWNNIYLIADSFTDFINKLYEFDIDDDGNEIVRYQDGAVIITPVK